MRKMVFFVLAAAVLSLMVPAQNAQAQSETPKVEIGAHYTRLRLRDFETTDHGVGLRLTLNITDGLGIEGEVNIFPRGRDNLAAPTSFSGVSQRTQGLFGVKYGMRSEKAGIFGKIRPGFMHFGENSLDITFSPPIPTTTEFALDIGGVFELYPMRRVAFRFDIGDAIIRFGGLGFTSHNLQITTGVALRF
jgi:outer membrane protein with beta-barrel domain